MEPSLQELETGVQCRYLPDNYLELFRLVFKQNSVGRLLQQSKKMHFNFLLRSDL